jgi:transposase InsO family protein
VTAGAVVRTTNGTVERFNRTLADEWAYVRIYRSNAARIRALDRWLHTYNHHRGHTALGGEPPIARATNLAGEHRYKTELMRRRGPCRGVDDVEFATRDWVDWFNHRRLHGEIG